MPPGSAAITMVVVDMSPAAPQTHLTHPQCAGGVPRYNFLNLQEKPTLQARLLLRIYKVRPSHSTTALGMCKVCHLDLQQ